MKAWYNGLDASNQAKPPMESRDKVLEEIQKTDPWYGAKNLMGYLSNMTRRARKHAMVICASGGKYDFGAVKFVPSSSRSENSAAVSNQGGELMRGESSPVSTALDGRETTEAAINTEPTSASEADLMVR